MNMTLMMQSTDHLNTQTQIITSLQMTLLATGIYLLNQTAYGHIDITLYGK